MALKSYIQGGGGSKRLADVTPNNALRVEMTEVSIQTLIVIPGF